MQLQLVLEGFFLIIAISASFVTCCMSINTADFLCQCIVRVLGIMFLFFVLLFVFSSLKALSDEFCWLTDLCTEPEIVSQTPGGLLYSLWKNINRRRKKRENPGLFWWSCIRLRYYSIWCAICDSWMFFVYLCSPRPARGEKTVE